MRKPKRSKRPITLNRHRAFRKSTLIKDAYSHLSLKPIRSPLLRAIVVKPKRPLVAKKLRERQRPLTHTRTIEPVRRIRSCEYRKEMMRKLAAQVKASGGSLHKWRSTLRSKPQSDCRK